MKDEVLKLAVEAGFNPDFDDYVYEHADRFVRFAKLVRNDYSYKHAQLWLSRIKGAVEAEREACADIAENWRCNGMPRTGVANEIRARGNQ